MPIVLYELPASGPCRAVKMTAENLGIELDLKYVNLFAGEQLKSEFLAMNPQHCVPTIDDNGFYLWESRVIMTYLVNKYGPDSPLYPKDPEVRAAVDRMLYFDLGTIYKTQRDYIAPVLFEGRPADPEKEEVFKKALGLFDQLLERTSYAAANHLTLADYSLLGTLSFVTEVGGCDFAPFPRIANWYEKMKEEIPHYKEINEIPLKELKTFLDSRKKTASS